MSSKKDYYGVLGVSRNATDKEIKRAYKKLILKYHPDRNPDNKEEAREKSKEINEAYDVLKDPEKKAKYDEFGSDAFDTGSNYQNSGGFKWDDIFKKNTGYGSFSDFDDIWSGFSQKTQTQKAKPKAERGADIRYDLEITFEEAAFGKDAELEVTREENCKDCNGTGAAKGSKSETCPICRGRGQVETGRITAFGRIVSRQTCSNCNGTGEIIQTPCRTCRGTGKKKTKRRIKVTIPKGVNDGSRVRVTSGGEAGSFGGEYGDLYVYIHVKPHKLFKRQGNDVILELPISIVQATLGDKVKVPTIDGQVELTIPEGIQSGKILRIREKGIPYLRGSGRGDEHIVIKVVTPKNLTDKQKSLLREFQNVSNTGVNPEEKSFMDKVKDMFNHNK